MSLETSLVAVLQPLCSRVYPDVAPIGAALPYITYQQIGGMAATYTEGALPSLRCAWVQVNVWCTTRAEAVALALAVEQALVSASVPGFTARPQAAMQAAHDDGSDQRGTRQDFEIWAPR